MTELKLLSDPKNDRVVKSVLPPIHDKLPADYVFSELRIPKWINLLKAFLNEGRLACVDAFYIVEAAKLLLLKEPNLITLQDPINIVGDLHGQLHDLNKILELGGEPGTNKYVFLGDYVDRGFYSVEIILLLYSIKICFPSNIILLRGNHECREKANECNFKTECIQKYTIELYKAIVDSFDALPLACTINNKFFAVHGGLSPKIKSVADINKLNRFQEPKEGIGYACYLETYYGLIQ